MRNKARLALILVTALVAAMVIPRSTTERAFAALAQITPTLIPDILDSPTPTVDPNDPGGGGGGGGTGGGGGGTGGGGTGGGGTGGGGGGDSKGDGKNDKKGDGKDGNRGGAGGDGKKKKKKNKDETDVPGSIANRIPGAFDTTELVAVAARLRSLGMSQSEVIRRVYPPFIIAGPASWIDTWHAPRYGPAPGQVRVHEGQDVFCDYGDPILAPVNGYVDFSNGGLGGITARVHDPSSGRYWYMTHLSDLNTDEFSTGDNVQAGDVVGYCGNTGNAASTPPHVHFGWYAEGGTDPRNPMRHLVDWLREAEQRVLGVVTKTTEKNIKNQPTLTAERMFGDGFMPDLSVLRIESESLWASGSDPASGAFALAESALQAALAGGTDTEQGAAQDVDYYLGAGRSMPALFDPDSGLAQLLEEADHHAEGSD